MPTNAATPQAVPPQILIAATFTATPLEEPLQFWLRELGLTRLVAFAPYQQLFQNLLDPTGFLAQNRSGANVILFRFEDLDSHRDLHRIKEHTRELLDALIRAAELFPAPLLVCACPRPPAFSKQGKPSRWRNAWARKSPSGSPVIRTFICSPPTKQLRAIR